MNGIKLPVSLEVLLSSVADLLKTLSTLKPNTTGFKLLLAIILNLRADMDKLAIGTSKPFINLSQFTSVEKTIDNMEDSFRKVELIMSRLSFSDLKLDENATKEFNLLELVITNIKNSIRAAKEEAKTSLLSDDFTKGVITNIDANAATKTFDLIIKVILSKTKQVEKEYEIAERNLRTAEKAVLEGQVANKLSNTKGEVDPLKDILGDKYTNFFTKKNDFKSNGSQLFAEYLKDRFQLKESEVEAIRGKTANEVRKLLAETNSDINKALKQFSALGTITEQTQIPELKKIFSEKESARSDLSKVNEVINESNDNITKIAELQKPALEQATKVLNDWKDAQAAAARSPKELESATSRAVAGFDNLRNALNEGSVAFLKFQSLTNTFNSLKMAVTNFMGFSLVLNLVKSGVREAANHIKELDSVMNGIAIVTDMTTGDLWNLIDSYSAMAQRYGVSIQGAYEVSKIYYQQGLETVDVMTLTNETLKLSKISGMDYATATDYMTTAIRGFKMEMSDAAIVVDVYSALAANTAVSQEELAVAMSKTASSMEGVGATFEEASAMIGTMVAVTRESATNIGSAMKSIASRYGELTKDPLGFQDSEGEAYSFNKVDAALLSVGISMKTVDGQFRNFTDVIIELGEKWNDLDSTQLRYIATQFAGNRLQSRFLALVSNVDTLKANIDVANNSEDTGTVLALKSLDSVETKLEQVRVAYLQFYTSIGAESVWKNALDGIKNFIDNLNSLWKVGDKLPIGAITVIIDSILLLKDIGRTVLLGIANVWLNIFPPQNINTEIVATLRTIGEEGAKAYAEGLKNKQEEVLQATLEIVETAKQELKEAEVQESKTPVIDTKVETVQKEVKALEDTKRAVLENVLSGAKDIDFTDQSAVDAWIESLKTKAAELPEEMKAIPNDVILSIVIGLVAGEGPISQAAETMVSGIIPTIRAALNMHSPSPTIIAMFLNGVGDAVAIGLNSSIEAIEAAATHLGLSIPEALRESLSQNNKITLNDFFDTNTSEKLFLGIIRKELLDTNKAYEELSRKFTHAVFDNKNTDILNKQAQRAEEKIEALENMQGRIRNIRYEGISSKFMTATHNFDPQFLEGMASWGGRMPSPSIALLPKDAKFREDFGGRDAATAYMPYKFANPELGLSHLYTGDAYTPTISVGANTYDEARESLDASPEIDLAYFKTRFTDFLRDAIHVSNLEIALEHLDKVAALPYGRDDYRITPTRDKNLTSGKENILSSLVSYYLSKGGFLPEGATLKTRMPGAELTGQGALLDALYHTLELMMNRPLSPELESTLLKADLYTSFKDKAKINVGSRFADSGAEGLVEEALDFIHFVKDNPGYDWMEVKPKGDVLFSDLAAFAAPYGYEEELLAAFDAQNGLDPKRTFIFDNHAEDGPTSKKAIENYIKNNVPGVAFGAHGEELVGKDALEAINLDRLHAALANPDLGLGEQWLEIIEKDVKGLFDNDLGIVLLNSLKASLSSIDSPNTEPLEMDNILKYYSRMYDGLDKSEVGMGMPVIAGAILGMQDVFKEPINIKSLGGSLLKDYLADKDEDLFDNIWTEEFVEEENRKKALEGAWTLQDGFDMLGLTDVAEKALSGVDFSGDDVAEKINTFCQTMISAAGENGAEVRGAFEELGLIGTAQAVEEGITEGIGSATSAATTLGASILEALRSAINAHSPSPTIIALFKTGVGEAIEIGITASSENVISAAQKLGIEVTDALKQALEKNEKVKLFEFVGIENALKLYKEIVSQTKNYLDWPSQNKTVDSFIKALIDDARHNLEKEAEMRRKYEDEAEFAAPMLGMSREDYVLKLLLIWKATQEKAADIQTNENNDTDASSLELVTEAYEEATEAAEEYSEAKQETTDSDNSTEIQTIKSQIEYLKELLALRLRINSGDKGAEKEFSDVRKLYNLIYGPQGVTLVSWNTGEKNLQARIDALEKPATESAVESASEALVSEQQAENANIDALGGIAELAAARAQESAEQAKESAEKAEEAANKAAELIQLLNTTNEENEASPSEENASNANYEEWLDLLGSEYEAYLEQFSSLPISDELNLNAEELAEAEVKVAKAVKTEAEALEDAKRIKEHVAETNFKNIEALDEEAKALETTAKAQEKLSMKQKLGNALNFFNGKNAGTIRNVASAMSMLSGVFDLTSQAGKTMAGSLLLVSGALKIFSSGGNITAIVSGIITVINAIDTMIEDDSERLERLTKQSLELSDAAKVSKNEYKTLESTSEKYEELKEKRYESAESAEAYLSAVDDLTSKFPELIASFDDAGNAILNESALTDTLTEARKKSALAAYDAAKAEVERAKAAKELDLKDAKKNLKLGVNSLPSSGIHMPTGIDNSAIDNYSNFDYIKRFKKSLAYGENDTLSFIAEFANMDLNNLARSLILFAMDSGLDQYIESDKIIDSNKLDSVGEETYRAIDTNKFILILSNLTNLPFIAENTELDNDVSTLLNVLYALTDVPVTEETQLQAVDEINNAISEMKTALDSDNDLDIFNAQKKLTDTLNKWRDAKYGLYDQISQLEDNLGDGYKKLAEYSSENLLLISAEKLLINLFLNGLADNLNLAIANSGEMLGVITDKVYKQYQEFIKTEEGKDIDLTTYLESYADIFSEEGLGTLAEQWYNSLTEDRQKAFETLFNDLKYYNAEDIIKQFEATMPSDVQQAIRDYYTDYETNINDRLIKRFSDKDSAIANQINALLKDEDTRFTLGDENLINAVQDEYENLAAYGIGEGSRAARYAEAASTLISLIYGLDGAAAAFVEKTIATYGTSQEGLQKANDAIRAADDVEGLDLKAIDGITGSLDNMVKEYVNSAVLRIQALLDEFTSAWKDTSGNLSAASSGMDISAALNWLKDSKQYFDAAGKFLNLELTDLLFIDGQFYATAELAAVYREGYLKKYQDGVKKETGILLANITNLKTASEEELATYAEQAGLAVDLYFTRENEKSPYELRTDINRGDVEDKIKTASELAITDANNSAVTLGLWFADSLLLTALESLKISEYLLGERTDKDRNNFKRRLQNVAIEKKGHELDESIIESWASTLEKGGQTAVLLAKKLYSDISEEELAKIYSAPFDNYSNVIKQLSEVSKGSVVTGELRKILSSSELGMADANGVVNDTLNMVQAYHAIYDKMRTAAGATVAGLNDVYAEMLTAEDLRNIDITETLKNGAGMSYADFGNLLAKYDISFEEYMTNHFDAVMRDGFGNIRITDWNAFAESIWGDNLDQVKNTLEYTSAFKAYNDGLIELNKNAEDAIVEEIKQIESAKAGDWLNLSALWLKITDSVNQAIENVEPEWYNGNVKNLGHRVRVPESIMAEHFSLEDYDPDNYSTIFGASYASREFMGTFENIGMTFALLTESGEAVTDLENYVQTLLTQAATAAGGADKVTVQMIKALDSLLRNLLLNIEAYDNSLSVSEVLEKEYEKAFELHERDADASWFGHLQDRLENFGATFEDGILKLGDNANLIGIADTLSQMAENAGLEIGNGLEEVQDAVKSVLDAIRESITKGIKGSLTGTERQDLITQALNMGIENLDFVETKEGFKLTNESAKELYFTLNDINGLLGLILFDELKDSLIETDARFRTVQDTTTHIIELQNELNTLRSLKETPENLERIAALEDELALAEKINRVRSVDSLDDSFNFMNNKIPDALNNPLNYWENWGKAFKAMKEAGKAKGKAKNTIGYEDFYNIVTEIGNLADLSGQAVTVGGTVLNNSLAAADLITQAAGALKNVDGEMKIDLSKINIDFSSGLQDLGKLVDKQVDALAESLIAMLDSVIAVLEIIVAMEALEDVDTDKDMEIELPEIAISTHSGEDGEQYITDFTQQMDSARRMIAEAFASSEEGKNALELVYINTKAGSFTIGLIVTATEEQLEQMGVTADMYTKIFNNLFKMYKDQDYNDLTGTVQSVFDVFGKYDWGDMSLTVNSGNHMLTLTDNGTYELNFVNADYDNYRKIFTEEKKKNDETIRKELLDKYIEESKSEEGISIETHRKIKVLQKSVVLMEDGDHKGEYKAGGLYYKTLEEAVAASDLYDIGAKNINVTGLGTTANATGQITIGKYTMDVKSNLKGPIFVADGEEFTSLQDALDFLFTGKKNQEVDHSSVEYKTWEILLGISVEPVFNMNGKSADINKNAQLREAINKYVAPEGGLDVIDGTVKVNLDDGIEVTIPESKIEVDPTTGKATAESINAYFDELTGIDLNLKDTIKSAITEAFSSLPEAIEKLETNKLTTIGQSFTSALTALLNLATSSFWDTLAGKIATIVDSIKQLLIPEVPNLKSLPKEESQKSGKTFDTEGQGIDELAEDLSELNGTKIDFDSNAAQNTLKELDEKVEELQLKVKQKSELLVDKQTAETDLDSVQTMLDKINEGAEAIIKAQVGHALIALRQVVTLLGSIVSKNITINVHTNYTTSGKSGGREYPGGMGTDDGSHGKVPFPIDGLTTGNVGLAKAKGTLMGELGPELVVSNGRYFIAGQNGAEMVNLADDAIVFNHLQTEQLLKKGMSNSRGKAVTSEKNAVAFATGNTGPAMASASAALAALKQLRAMWESLKGASISDLAGAGGGGGGGGGGGDKSKIVDPSIWIDTVERWYNLMQKIALLEKEITHEETLRSKLQSDWNANGNHYYASLKRSLEALRDLIDAQEQLNLSRLAYYDLRVEALEKSPFGKLISFNNEGQMFFLKGAMEWLTDLAGFDSLGKANYTDEEKYNRLIAAGYGDYMKYNDGGEIKMDGDNDGEVTDEERQSFYSDATKAFWDRIDEYKETTQSLWDSIKEGEDDLLKLQADQNDLFEEIRDNQMEVEDAVLDAIIDMRLREIDALQDERDKLEESTLKYIDGLTDALNNERQMYENQEEENSLNQQRRRLAILQRSGGSAQDIANLRSEIDSSERDRYFNLLQLQIDAILAASDLEIERMDSLIEIMNETLEYLKEYGLLWGNVYAVMQESSEKIVSFITNADSQFWANSLLSSLKVINDYLFKTDQWTSYRKDLAETKENTGAKGTISKDVASMVTMTRELMKDNDYRIFDEAMKKEFGNDYDKNGTYKDIFYSEYQEHGDLTKVSASARAKYAADKAAAEAAKKAAELTTAPAAAPTAAAPTSGGSGGGSGGDSKKPTDTSKIEVKVKGFAKEIAAKVNTDSDNSKDKNTTSKDKVVTDQVPSLPKESGTGSGVFSNLANALKASPTISTTTTTTKTTTDLKKTNKSSSTLASIGAALLKKLTGNKASGGYVNHGIYELGERGTETVLTASQTKVLRDNILSNRPNSLISLLKSYNEGYDGINNSVSGVTPIEDNSTVIEKVELNMEVKQIANDYDARRAGEQALNEMMRIARKTGATNSIRR